MMANMTSNRKEHVDASSSYQYKIWEAEKFVEAIKLWRRQYADFVTVGTSQSKYGLPISTAATESERDDNGMNDCPYDEGIHGCYNYFFTIQDKVSHLPDSKSASMLPEILWIGGLHHEDYGLGTTILMETVSLLLEAASCEAKPRIGTIKGHRHNNEEEIQEAKDCRSKLLRQGITQQQRQWLARLVSTRRIVVVPIADPIRFYRQQQRLHYMDFGSYGSLYFDRKEDVTPQMDFALSSTTKIPTDRQCMQSIAARTINELFCDHMFQIMLSFHSSSSSSDGEQGQTRRHRRWFGTGDKVGYPWSTDDTVLMTTPDNEANNDIAKTLLRRTVISKFDGSTSSIDGSDVEDYQSGPINELLFPERSGSIEDWSYAASWWDNLLDNNNTVESDDESSHTTAPRQYCQKDGENAHGHTRKRKSYNNNESHNRNATNRAISMRIVIDDKSQQNHLGSVRDVFNIHHDENQNHNYDNSSEAEIDFYDSKGMVARHIRVVLESADLVQPYVTISAIETMSFSDDIIPLTPLLSDREYCQNSKSAAVSPSTSKGEQGLEEAGMTKTPSSKTVSIKWTAGGSIEVVESHLWYASLLDVSDDDYIWDCSIQPDRIPRGFRRTDMKFTTKYNRGDGTGWDQTSGTHNFETKIDIANFSVGEELVVIASAIVDQKWRNCSDGNDHNCDGDPMKGQDVRFWPPQSHLVNARTNPLWQYNNVGKKIKGRLVWYSKPVAIVIADNNGDDLAEGNVVELSGRFGQVGSPQFSSTLIAIEDNNSSTLSTGVFVLLAGFGFLVSFMLLVAIKRIRLRTEILKKPKRATGKGMNSVDSGYAFDTDERDYFYDESCPVHVCSDSYVEDYYYDDGYHDGNWEIIDFTIK